MKTFVKKNKKKSITNNKKTFAVWVVIRHTRSGDQRIAIYDDNKKANSRELAMERAEEVAQQAANDYGHGSASVFKGKLILSSIAEKP